MGDLGVEKTCSEASENRQARSVTDLRGERVATHRALGRPAQLHLSGSSWPYPYFASDHENGSQELAALRR